ncbi:MAG: AraC family transcriptional regulator [Anaerolineae bacterium]|nr:AraC family transcriptional regulator [Anaerolineae bacterium]
MQIDYCQPEFFRHTRYPLEARRASFSQSTFKRHYHEGYAIGMVEKGASRFSWNQGDCVVQPGSIVLINPGEVHVCNPLPQSRWTYRMIYLGVSWVNVFISPSEFLTKVIMRPAFYQALCRLYDALKRPASDLESDCALTETLFMLFENYGSGKTQRLLPLPSHALQLAQAYLMDHLCENISLEELAGVAGLSPFHLLRSFRQYFGMPPHMYQNLQRVQQARRLINHQSLPLSTLATSLGFSDQSHFNRVFKGAFGLPPGQYQQICRQMD